MDSSPGLIDLETLLICNIVQGSAKKRARLSRIPTVNLLSVGISPVQPSRIECDSRDLAAKPALTCGTPTVTSSPAKAARPR